MITGLGIFCKLSPCVPPMIILWTFRVIILKQDQYNVVHRGLSIRVYFENWKGTFFKLNNAVDTQVSEIFKSLSSDGLRLLVLN
jgi:hypothetical protein